MSYHEYTESQRLAGLTVPFYALIMAAMRRADTDNLQKLQAAWPDVWAELRIRYWSPDGLLESERVARIAIEDGTG